jgi:23S rRNA (adenine2503-C2)-methyltransferase
MTLEEAAKTLGWKPFRLKQVWHARENELKTNWGDITPIPKSERDWLSAHVPFDSLKILKTKTSEEGSAVKWLLEAGDRQQIETVLLIHTGDQKTWGTVCVSSQVGCPMRCTFCATGQMGLVRDLTTDEILDQFLIARREADSRGLVGHLNVVFMGMGEPLLNLDSVIPAIKILTDPKRHGLSPSRVTVSTSGIVPGLEKLDAQELEIGLALSLHAPTDALRSTLMPANTAYPLASVMAELRKWEKRGTEILYEYILIDHVNDRTEDAEALAKLLKGRNAKVNLIPLNPVPSSPFKRPSNNRMHAFLAMLEKAGIEATLRHTKGDDIKAACGQLKTERH